jgi:hypothetical protein
VKVGDLVQIKNYSSPRNIDSDRLAIVTDIGGPLSEYYQIMFTDTIERYIVNISNLRLISESR